MAHAHQIVSTETAAYFERYRRNVYVTPRSYLAFVTSYTVMYRQKQSDVSELARKIKVGLAKLDEANEDVAQMKVVLKEKEKTLAVAQEKSAVLLQEITASTAKAEKKKAEVGSVKDRLADEELAIIAEQKGAIEKELEAAGPALPRRRTRRGKSIASKDIGLLKNLKTPPRTSSARSLRCFDAAERCSTSLAMAALGSMFILVGVRASA